MGPDARVVAHESDKGRVPGQNVFAANDDEVTFGEEIRAKVIFNPGHTSGAISYYLEQPAAVFTGDTLFRNSIGRYDLPGGDGDQELQSIRDNLLTLLWLPPKTEKSVKHRARRQLELPLNHPYENLQFSGMQAPARHALRQEISRCCRQRTLSLVGA